MLDAVPTIIRKEGALALYTGVVPNIIGSSVAWGCYMYIYNTTKRQLKAKIETEYVFTVSISLDAITRTAVT